MYSLGNLGKFLYASVMSSVKWGIIIELLPMVIQRLIPKSDYSSALGKIHAT